MVTRYTLESLAAAKGWPSYAEAAGAPHAIPMASVSAGAETDVVPVGVGIGALAGIVSPIQPGVETEEPSLTLGVTNGVAPLLGEEAIYPEVTAPVAIPTAIPFAGAIAAVMSLGVFKALLARFGPIIVKAILGGAFFATAMKLVGLGFSDDTIIPGKIGAKKKKRYSIGANPRVGTVAKVSRHCMRILKRHRKVIDEFLPPKRRALPAAALARTYLSTAERKALKA